MRSIVPYFVLGLFLIITYRAVMEIEFFATHINRFWYVLTPFLVGGIIAYILNLPCNSIQRLYLKINNRLIQKRSRGLSVLTLIIIIIILGVIAFNLIVPRIVESIATFAAEAEHYEATFRGWMSTVESWNLPEFLPEIDEEVVLGYAYDFFANLDTDRIASSVMAGFGSAFRALFRGILMAISTIYILLEKDKLKAYTKRFVAAVTTQKTNDSIIKYSRKLNHNFHMYIYAQTIDGIILGSIMTGFLFLFQSPHALLLGLILGIVNYIPYFGSIFGTAFAVSIMALTQGIPTAAVASIFMFIIQQTDGNVIQPKLLGGSFSLSPLLVIISVSVGMAYAGVFGMLVVVPIVAIFKDVLDEYIEHREYQKLNPSLDEETFMDRGIG
jgi:predicted PurR-regulated permease PerM